MHVAHSRGRRGIVSAISTTVECAAEAGERQAATGRAACYDGVAVLEVEDLLARWAVCTRSPAAVYVAAAIYMDRFVVCSGVHITQCNKLRVLLCALLMAEKFYKDTRFTNAAYADIVGIPLAELNRLERLFVCDIDFKLFVRDDELALYSNVFECM